MCGPVGRNRTYMCPLAFSAFEAQRHTTRKVGVILLLSHCMYSAVLGYKR